MPSGMSTESKTVAICKQCGLPVSGISTFYYYIGGCACNNIFMIPVVQAVYFRTIRVKTGQMVHQFMPLNCHCPFCSAPMALMNIFCDDSAYRTRNRFDDRHVKGRG